MSAPTKFWKPGDKVVVAPEFAPPPSVAGRVFTITKVNPKNVVCSADDGGRGISYPADTLRPYDPDAAPVAPPLGRPYVYAEIPPPLGTIVTLKRAFKTITVDTPLVVVASKGGKVNVTLVGGDNDRYVRVPTAGVVVRDLAWLTETLAKATV